MKNSLQLRTSQHLTLTPQLQQSIKLLQLSTIELQQELEQIIRTNPLLERIDDPLEKSVRFLPDGAITPDNQSYTPPQTANSEQYETKNDTETASKANANAPSNYETEENYTDAQNNWSLNDNVTDKSPDDDEGRPQIEAAKPTLREHLSEQARLSTYDQRTRALLTILIDALDDKGYLLETPEEICAWLPLELRVDEKELKSALKILQTFDPVGIGARNIAECLALQIKQLPKIPFITRKHALQIVENHLKIFAQKDFNKLKKLLNYDDEDLREAQEVIRRCSPNPASAFLNDAADTVTPDVIVKKAGKKWIVELNQSAIPKLQINSLYAEILKNNRGNNSLSSQLQEAKYFIKNVAQRFQTILRVSQAIAEKQRNFFSHGPIAMRPLVLREIADKLGMHESTISRVTTQKFMLTPHGIFELKYFFGSHVSTEAGGEASSTAIRELIKQFIGAEDPKKPLSDSKIPKMLEEQGMVVARRTVAKYRESMKIPAVSLRKSL